MIGNLPELAMAHNKFARSVHPYFRCTMLTMHICHSNFSAVAGDKQLGQWSNQSAD